MLASFIHVDPYEDHTDKDAGEFPAFSIEPEIPPQDLPMMPLGSPLLDMPSPSSNMGPQPDDVLVEAPLSKYSSDLISEDVSPTETEHSPAIPNASDLLQDTTSGPITSPSRPSPPRMTLDISEVSDHAATPVKKAETSSPIDALSGPSTTRPLTDREARAQLLARLIADRPLVIAVPPSQQEVESQILDRMFRKAFETPPPDEDPGCIVVPRQRFSDDETAGAGFPDSDTDSSGSDSGSRSGSDSGSSESE